MTLTQNRDLLTLTASPAVAPQLDLQIGCDRQGQSFVRRQYAAYPFRLSRCFRLDADQPRRAYLYLMNAAPGLFAGDALTLRVRLNDHSQLYLTDQAAMKVHRMPVAGSLAQLTQHISLGAETCLEYIPEPLILYAEAALQQRSHIVLHPTAQLVWSEIIVPGRLARQEWYDFRQYDSRLRVESPDGRRLFSDAMVLTGQTNPFKHQPLFAALPAIATLILVLPGVDLDPLTTRLSSFQPASDQRLEWGYSHLPNCPGLVIRAIADSASTLKAYSHFVRQQSRHLTHQPPLPEVPK